MSAAPVRASGVVRQRRAALRLDRLRAADEARHAVLRMVSHELRTPLNAIIGFSDLLASQVHGPLGAPEYAEYAGHIQRSGQQLLTLVNQTLAMARLEGGSADLSPEPEALAPAIAEAAEHAQHAQGVRVVVEPIDKSVKVRADPAALGTMLAVLMQQAAAATPAHGSVQVRARVLATRIVVEVRDEGPGHAARTLPDLLRPFAPGEAALANRGAGSGLELPMARLLAKASGGSLKLTSSAAAGGMTATLSLPRA
jgi:signal transduction histidine kinase